MSQETPAGPGPHAIDAVRPVLTPDSHAVLMPVTPSFYEQLGTRFTDFAGHVLVQRFAFDAAWDTWEIHPVGDELVFLVDGDVDFVLWVDDSEQIVRVHEPGSYVVVPMGTWHTARPRAPTTLLFITPGEGTLNASHPTDHNPTGDTL